MAQVAGPGWFTDPVKRHVYRYWDGTHWTDQVSDRGDVTVDPLDAGDASPTLEVAADRLPVPKPTQWSVEPKESFAMPPLCCVCGQPSSAGRSIGASSSDATVGPGMTGTVGMRFPLCDRCDAIRASVEKGTRGGTGFFGFHGTKEQKVIWNQVRLSAAIEHPSKGVILFTFMNPEFADAFHKLNGTQRTYPRELKEWNSDTIEALIGRA